MRYQSQLPNPASDSFYCHKNPLRCCHIWHVFRYKMTTLPILLPGNVIPKPSPLLYNEWKPQRYLSEPQPPPQDDGKIIEQEMANARQMLDGKIIKKTRPRRTVDYNGSMGRWALVGKSALYHFISSEGVPSCVNYDLIQHMCLIYALVHLSSSM